MEEVILEKKASLTERNLEAYFNSHDVQYVAEDGVFISMNTGEKPSAENRWARCSTTFIMLLLMQEQR